MKPTTPRCIVCQWEAVNHLGLCRACQKSYDRFNRYDSTTLGLIEWTARRARNTERFIWKHGVHPRALR